MFSSRCLSTPGIGGGGAGRNLKKLEKVRDERGKPGQPLIVADSGNLDSLVACSRPSAARPRPTLTLGHSACPLLSMELPYSVGQHTIAYSSSITYIAYSTSITYNSITVLPHGTHDVSPQDPHGPPSGTMTWSSDCEYA